VRSWLALPFIFVLSSAKTPTSCVDDGRQALLIVHGLFDLELPMRYETLTLGGNVIRFPVELRRSPRSIFWSMLRRIRVRSS
jgi:hypothetical protein